MIGTRLGRYQILEQLGAGGMGEVYLAEDTRLGRKVAVKVLPSEFATDPDRLARFEQEARAAAALNHPHIAAVFDGGSAVVEAVGGDGSGDGLAGGGVVEAVGGDSSGDRLASGAEVEAADAGAEVGTVVHYIVQEYLEGQTLRETIAAGPLRLRKSLLLATEVAEALTAAHAVGVVHRDLKPENVFVTRDGHAKLLDFGLAKLTAKRKDPSSATAASTIPPPGTRSPTFVGTAEGQFMGTAGYMAPEQIEGGAIDRRTDLFSFGCLLYELVGGETPFKGKSLHDTLHRIGHEDPAPLDGSKLPLRLRWIIEKCLQKEPAERYQDGDDLLVDLRTVSERLASGTAELPAAVDADAGLPRGAGWRMHAGWAAALVVAVAATAMAVMNLLPDRSVPDRPARQLTIDLGADGQLLGQPILSPDGAMIASFTRGALQVMDLETGEVRELHRGESARGGGTPVWSPDSASLAFAVPEGGIARIRTVPARGGPSRIIYEGQRRDGEETRGGGGAPGAGGRAGGRGGRGGGGGLGAGGGAWRGDGTIVFGRTTGLVAVSVDGSGASSLLTVEDRGTRHTSLVLLPDDTLLYMEDALGEPLRLLHFDGQDSTLVRTLDADWSGSIRGAGDRLILFDRRDVDELWAIPFDYRTGSSQGAPFRIVDGASSATLSREGSLIYGVLDDAVYTDDELVRVRPDGSMGEPLVTLESTLVREIELSPDEERVALAVDTADDASALRVYETGGTATPMTLMDSGFLRIAGWTDDGQRLAVSFDAGEFSGQVQIMSIDGADAPVPIGPGRSARLVPNTSMLLYSNSDDRELRLVRLSADGTVAGEETFMPGPSSLFIPYVSPTAALMAALVRSADGLALLVTPFRSTGPPSWQLSENAGGIVWSHDGRELYFVDRTEDAATMMVASVTTDRNVSIGAAEELFPLAPADGSAPLTGVYDVAADGTFLMVRRQPQPGAPPARLRHVLVENWEGLYGAAAGR